MGQKKDLTGSEKSKIVRYLAEGCSSLKIAKLLKRDHRPIKRFIQNSQQGHKKRVEKPRRQITAHELRKVKRAAAKMPLATSLAIFQSCNITGVPKSTRCAILLPKSKPWINGDVRAALAARNTAFASANTSDYKHAHYQLRKTIKAAKREYRDRVEQQFDNPRSMWQGLNTITDFRGKTSTPQTTASLCEDLNVFYARFDAANTMRPDSVRTADDVSAHTVSEEDVRKCFRKVNARKATGPDGIPGRVLKSCTAQLAGVFTHIFNLSLSLSVVPACFKMATIVPVPKSSTISSLNDWRPVVLTPIVSKCFEKLQQRRDESSSHRAAVHPE
ncbi:uncharacterized protein LOC143420651 [Maylandia zebra]|uniref:uncharacterized protein LOC143420651 n=1 Tax=Maylandia zebra TaxID=106582 RepID=UPI00403D3183